MRLNSAYQCINASSNSRIASSSDGSYFLVADYVAKDDTKPSGFLVRKYAPLCNPEPFWDYKAGLIPLVNWPTKNTVTPEVALANLSTAPVIKKEVWKIPLDEQFQGLGSLIRLTVTPQGFALIFSHENQYYLLQYDGIANVLFKPMVIKIQAPYLINKLACFDEKLYIFRLNFFR